MAEDDTPPTRAPGQHDGRPRARSLAWAVISALAVFSLVALVLVNRSGGERSIRTIAASRHSTVTVPPTTGYAAPTTTTTHEAITTPEPTTTTTTTNASKQPRTPPASTTTTKPVLRCSDSEIAVKVETDKPVYAAGERITITVLATNTAPYDCRPVSGTFVRILASDGTVVYDLAGPVAHWPEGARLPAGQTWRETYHRWDQHCEVDPCRGVQQPPGEYTVEATLRGYGSARTTIQLGAGF